MTFDIDKSAWRRITFGDVIENVADRVDNPSAAGVDRYVGLEHLDPGVMTVQRWDSPDKVEAQKLRFQSGDVIFGRRRAYQKKVSRADFEGICSAHALVLRARPDAMQPDFLAPFLSSDYFLDRAIAISVGSLSPTVNWRDLKVQEFLLPTELGEQQRIADLLWAIEDHRQRLGELKAHAASLEEPLLTLSAPLHLSVSDVVAVARSGGTPLRSNKAFYGGDIPWLKSGEVIGDGIHTTEETITLAGLAGSATWLAPSGTIVIAMYGDGKTRGQVGRIEVPMTTNQAVLALVPDKSKCDPDFLYYWLRSRQQQLREKGAGAAQKNLSKGLIVSEPFPDLSTGEQRNAVSALTRLTRTLETFGREVDALASLRRSLSAEAFGDVK